MPRDVDMKHSDLATLMTSTTIKKISQEPLTITGYHLTRSPIGCKTRTTSDCPCRRPCCERGQSVEEVMRTRLAGISIRRMTPLPKRLALTVASWPNQQCVCRLAPLQARCSVLQTSFLSESRPHCTEVDL